MNIRKHGGRRMTCREGFACVPLLILLSGASPLMAGEPVDVARERTCIRDGRVHRIEIRSVASVSGVCDIVRVRTDERTEERTLHQGDVRGEFCRERFEDRVASLVANGWACPVASGTGSGRMAAPSTIARSASVRLWRTRCLEAMAAREASAPELCDCAIEVLDEAGFEESDYEVLASPIARGRPIGRLDTPDCCTARP